MWIFLHFISERVAKAEHSLVVEQLLNFFCIWKCAATERWQELKQDPGKSTLQLCFAYIHTWDLK